ncbi:winged helix-turn-helix domain-containing protein [Xanthomonas populi]|uniref:winged helix-turn-helix domain-containing protein n=1 Tax=Xanthomonas populi TaxID=53414 RepID=UPI0024486B5D|nr:winged helix-turn-helix domain-containing protein [Xanthomonas populi]
MGNQTTHRRVRNNVTTTQLMDRVYVDHRIVTGRTVDSHIKNVRRKLADVGGEEWVRSLYGVGYRFEL